MRNIRINEAESIFEVMWNGGGERYSFLSAWNLAGETACEKITSAWTGAEIIMMPGAENKPFPFQMEREGELDISEYDRLVMMATISGKIKFRMSCEIDGVQQDVMLSVGNGERNEFSVPIAGNLLTKVHLEFENLSRDKEVIRIVWLGLADSVKLKKMLSRKSPYTAEWPGCFKEIPEFKPQLGLYFGEEELYVMRQKVQSGPYKKAMDDMRLRAKGYMSMIPEEEVGEFINSGRFKRVRDQNRPQMKRAMQELAFVSLIDENEEMARMACRMALAYCHCRNFNEGITGSFPGVTWHHRSFSEIFVCEAIVQVMDWAGGMLTWHGKDIMYDALMMKGLPRMDSDIKTLDDIWYTNQGMVFISTMIATLITLTTRYPRYRIRVEEAEKDFLVMWENYVCWDGGSSEGGSYWNYTMDNVVNCIILLSRYNGKTIEEYAPDSVKRTGAYVSALISEAWGSVGYIPYSDSHPYSSFSPMAINFLACVGAGDIWKQKSNELNQKGNAYVNLMQILLMAKEYDLKEEICLPELSYLPETGITTVRRQTPDLGRTALFVLSGISSPGHAHQDKGSIILEAGRRALLIDRGICNYTKAETTLMSSSEFHNMVTAVKDGVHLSQARETNLLGGTYSGRVNRVECQEGKFFYETDVTACWNGIFEKNVRSIESSDPHLYVIRDSLKIDVGLEICFILNTYGEISQKGDDFLITDGDIQLRISTEGWKPTKSEYGLFGTDGDERPVSRLCLFTSGKSEYELKTMIQLYRINSTV